MNAYHLKYFLDAALASSVAQSARLNSVTHSAVSQAIRSLESEFGVELLVHKKRNFALTHAGQLLAERAQTFLHSLSEIRDEMNALDGEVSGHVRLAAPQSLLADALWQAVIQLKEKHPRLKISMQTGSGAIVKDLLREGRADLGVLLDDEDLRGFESQLLTQGHFVLVGRKKRVSLNEAPLMVTQYGKVEVQKLLNEFRRTYKKEPRIEFEILSWSLIKKFALNSDFFGFVPDYIVRDELKAGTLLKKHVKLNLPSYQMKALWLRHLPLGRNMRLLIECMKHPFGKKK